MVGRDLTLGGERMMQWADDGLQSRTLETCMVLLAVTPKFYLKRLKIKKKKRK